MHDFAMFTLSVSFNAERPVWSFIIKLIISHFPTALILFPRTAFDRNFIIIILIIIICMTLSRDCSRTPIIPVYVQCGLYKDETPCFTGNLEEKKKKQEALRGVKDEFRTRFFEVPEA